MTLGQCCCSQALSSNTVSPSTPAAPLFRRTRSYACQRLLRSTTASIPCRSPSAFVCPSTAVPTSAPKPVLGEIRPPPWVQLPALVRHRFTSRSNSLIALFNVQAFGQGSSRAPRFVPDLLCLLLTSAGASMAHLPSRLGLSDLRRSLPYKFWALMISDISPSYAASYPLSVRQAKALPSASFRFTVARDTLAVRLTLPLVGRVEDFHLQVGAPSQVHHQATGPLPSPPEFPEPPFPAPPFPGFSPDGLFGRRCCRRGGRPSFRPSEFRFS